VPQERAPLLLDAIKNDLFPGLTFQYTQEKVDEQSAGLETGMTSRGWTLICVELYLAVYVIIFSDSFE